MFQFDFAGPTVNVDLEEASGGNIVTIAPTILDFDSSNWNIAQTATIAGVVDDDDLDDETTTYTLNSVNNAGGRELPAPVTRSVTAVDDDVQSLIISTVPATLATSIQEAGPAATITVRAGLPPAVDDGGQVVITLTSTIPNVVLNPTTLTYNTADFATPQEVTISATADIDRSDHNLDVTLASDPALVASVSQIHALRVIDRDVPITASLTVADFTGATLTTKRQNIRWGSTRLAYTAYDNAGNTVVFGNNRDLTDLTGPVSLGAKAPSSTESIEWDGTNFGAFALTNAGVAYNRFDENLVITDTSVLGFATADQIWPVNNEADDSYGMLFQESVNGNLYFQRVARDGSGSTAVPATVPDASEDNRPNLQHRGTAATSTSAFVVLYTEDGSNAVICRHLSSSGTIPAGSAEVTLTGFPNNGPFLGSFYRPDIDRVLAAYYNPSTGLTIATIRAHDCAALTHTTIGVSTGLVSPPPFVAYNGQQFAIAYDYFDLNTSAFQVAVALLSSDLILTSDYVVGAGTKPSIEWVTDRWAVRYEDNNNGSLATVVVGSFFQ
jgi:hypothetical protein